FSGMLLLGFGMIYRQQSPWFRYYSPVLAIMQPFLLAVLADYLVCMYSLSRNYVVTTYMMLGLITVFLRLSLTVYERNWYQMNFRMILIITSLGLTVFVVLKLFLRSFVQFSGS
ncbi:MAG TPA: hypothetical protein PKD72_02545, partial [Gemmatales bacterium]|nr:hypothetical protein [Gemmatales bacterium]